MGLFGSGRIFGAAAIAVALVLGSYVVARNGPSPVAEASEQSALLAAIAARDSDDDGLPDWEESLYGTDSHTYDSRSLGMSDGQAVQKGLIVPRAIAELDATAKSSLRSSEDGSVSGSLTASFSQHLYALYSAAKDERGGAPLTQEEGDALIDQALNDLARTVGTAPAFKNKEDLRIQGSGQSDLRAFAAAAEGVMLFNTSQATTSETVYLSNLVAGDSNAATVLESIAKNYRSSAAGIAALTIPQEAAPATLTLVNALMHISQIISDFARVNVDPLATILALNQYPEAVQALIGGLAELSNVYARQGVQLQEGEKGASFINILADIRGQKP